MCAHRTRLQCEVFWKDCAFAETAWCWGRGQASSRGFVRGCTGPCKSDTGDLYAVSSNRSVGVYRKPICCKYAWRCVLSWHQAHGLDREMANWPHGHYETLDFLYHLWDHQGRRGHNATACRIAWSSSQPAARTPQATTGAFRRATAQMMPRTRVQALGRGPAAVSPARTGCCVSWCGCTTSSPPPSGSSYASGPGSSSCRARASPASQVRRAAAGWCSVAHCTVHRACCWRAGLLPHTAIRVPARSWPSTNVTTVGPWVPWRP